MNKNLNRKNFKLIKHLYWEEGYDQYDLGVKFGCDQATISKVINDKILAIEDKRAPKKLLYSMNWQSPRHEPKQAKTLRCKRDKLHSTKLNIATAQMIRKDYFAGKQNQVELAASHKVNQSTICKLIQGDNWKTCKC